MTNRLMTIPAKDVRSGDYLFVDDTAYFIFQNHFTLHSKKFAREICGVAVNGMQDFLTAIYFRSSLVDIMRPTK